MLSMPAVRLLRTLGRGPALSERCAGLPRTFSTPELRIPCPDERKFSVVSEVERTLNSQGIQPSTLDGVRVRMETGWWLLRASNTEAAVVVRCETYRAGDLDALCATVAALLVNAGVDGGSVPGYLMRRAGREAGPGLAVGSRGTRGVGKPQSAMAPTKGRKDIACVVLDRDNADFDHRGSRRQIYAPRGRISMNRIATALATLAVCTFAAGSAVADAHSAGVKVYWTASGKFGPFNIQGLIPTYPEARDILIPINMWVIDHPKGLGRLRHR